jgi:hypothetical protein
MPISFECASCNASYEVGDELAGKMVLCRECDRRGKVPDTSAPPINHVCSKCRRLTEYPADMAGRWARCPACSVLARVEAANPTPPTRRKALFCLVGVLAVGMAGTGFYFLRGRPEADSRSGRSSNERSPRRQRREQEPGKEGEPPRGQRKGKGRRKRRMN